MQPVMGMGYGLVEDTDRIQNNRRHGGRIGNLDRARHLVQLECGTMLGAGVLCTVGDLWQIDLYELLALERTDHNLLTGGVMRQDRRNEIGQHWLQQETHDQQPRDECPLPGQRPTYVVSSYVVMRRQTEQIPCRLIQNGGDSQSDHRAMQTPGYQDPACISA